MDSWGGLDPMGVNGFNNGFSAAAFGEGSSGLKHNPGLATYWSKEEQAILEEGLIQHASEQSITRYAKIAMRLPDKTIRDVALRYQWMIRKEYEKRMEVDYNIPKENKDTKVEWCSEMLRQMPPLPLPVKAVEELANSSLHSPFSHARFNNWS